MVSGVAAAYANGRVDRCRALAEIRESLSGQGVGPTRVVDVLSDATSGYLGDDGFFGRARVLLVEAGADVDLATRMQVEFNSWPGLPSGGVFASGSQCPDHVVAAFQ